MILSGHQPNYMPYIGFFHKAASCDVFAIWDTVQFVKRGTFGWMNRNRIKTHKGPMWLTVPVLTKDKYTQSILDTKINNEVPWQRKHWRSIYLNYHKAPYFDKYGGFFEELYKKEWTSLSGLNEEIIMYMLRVLGIKSRIIKCSSFMLNSHGTDLIIDMCKEAGASRFLSGKHGRDYLDEKTFENTDIKLIYQDFIHPGYPQQFGEFIPSLSAVDLIFNCGPDSLDIIMRPKRTKARK